MLLPGIRQKKNIFKYWVQLSKASLIQQKKDLEVLYKAGMKLYNVTLYFIPYTLYSHFPSGLATPTTTLGSLTFVF